MFQTTENIIYKEIFLQFLTCIPRFLALNIHQHQNDNILPTLKIFNFYQTKIIGTYLITFFFSENLP